MHETPSTLIPLSDLDLNYQGGIGISDTFDMWRKKTNGLISDFNPLIDNDHIVIGTISSDRLAVPAPTWDANGNVATNGASGNFIAKGSISAKTLNVNSLTTNSNAIDDITITSSIGNKLKLNADSATTYLNPLVSTNDSSIIFGSAANDSKSLVIGKWTTGTGTGIVIKGSGTTSAGRVGINKIPTTYPLEVAGSIHAVGGTVYGDALSMSSTSVTSTIGGPLQAKTLATLSGALSATSGATMNLSSLKGTNTNATSLETYMLRDVGGSSWTTSSIISGVQVDDSPMAYVRYNGATNNNGISFGTTTGTYAGSNVVRTDRLTINSSGLVGIGTSPITGKILTASGDVTITGSLGVASVTASGNITCASSTTNGAATITGALTVGSVTSGGEISGATLRTGSKLTFGPDGENTDLVKIERINTEADVSQLRFTVGDNGDAYDSVLIGTAQSTWTEKIRFNSNGSAVFTGSVTAASKVRVNGVSSAASPGFAFGDPGNGDSGMFCPADGVIAFSQNGNERMRITSAGNVGVGIIAPSSKLHLSSAEIGWTGGLLLENTSGTSQRFALSTRKDLSTPARFSISDETNNQERFSILASNGNVGIGIFAPTEKLDISGNAKATRFLGPLTGDVTGNAATATKLATARTINNVTFDGSANVTTLTANTPNSLTAGTDLTTTPVSTTFNGSTAVTFNVDSSTTQAGKIVKRDASGNFSAGTITASLSGNVTGNVTGTVSGSSGSCTGNSLTATTADKVANSLSAGTGLVTTTAYNGSAARTFTVDATSDAIAGKIVVRDATGNFKTNAITANQLISTGTITTSSTVVASGVIYSGLAVAGGYVGQVDVWRNSQNEWNTAGLLSQSSNGNACISLHAQAGATAAVIRHVSGGSGVQILNSGMTYANLEAAAVTASGDIKTSSQIEIQNDSPTIYLRDTGSRSSMIHCNSNTFYILRGDASNSKTWSQYNSKWPLEISLENNDATFGGNVTAAPPTATTHLTTKDYVDNADNLKAPIVDPEFTGVVSAPQIKFADDTIQSTAVIPDSLPRAWVTFDGTNTVGTDCNIFAAYNVSKVNKVASGVYRLTFANQLPNTKYFATGSGVYTLSNQWDYPVFPQELWVSTAGPVEKTKTAYQIQMRQGGGYIENPVRSNVVIHGPAASDSIVFNDTIKFGIEQFQGDCWAFKLYTNAGSSQKFRINTALGSFYFNSNDANAWVNRYINSGRNSLVVNSIEAVDYNNARLYYWDVQLNFATGANVNGSTTNAFTVTQNATTTPKVVISNTSNTFAGGYAIYTADFGITGTSA